VEEQQVESEVLATDLQGVFGAEEPEITPQLDQKAPELEQPGVMEISFGVFRREIQNSNM
jgi:hypothetical protein